MGCKPFLGEQDAEVAGRWIRKVEITLIQIEGLENYEWIVSLGYFQTTHRLDGRLCRRVDNTYISNRQGIFRLKIINLSNLKKKLTEFPLYRALPKILSYINT